MMSGRSILICDDEVEIASEIAEFMESLGWSVSTAANDREAESMLNSGLSPDCLLTDLRMGNFDGKALIAATRRLPPTQQPRIIAVMTGHLEPSIAAADIGADRLYQKPIDPDDVAAELATLVDLSLSPSRA